MSDYGFKQNRRNLVWRILLFPVTIIQSLVGSGGSEGMKGGPKGIGGWLYAIFLGPFVWTGKAFVELMFGWASNRRSRALINGGPALAFGALILGVFLIGGMSRTNLDARYHAAFKEAANSDQITKASLYIDRAIRENPEKSEYVFKKAQLLISERKNDEAFRLLQTIATPEVLGYGEAHLLIANTLKKNFDKKKKSLPEPQRLAYQKQTFKDIEQHYRHAIASKSDKNIVNLAKFNFYQFLYATHRYREAAPLADQLVLKQYSLAAQHYKLFTKVMKNKTRAETVAEQTSKKLREEIIKSTGKKSKVNRWTHLWNVYLSLESDRERFDQAWAFQNQFFKKPDLTKNQAIFLRFTGASLKYKHSLYFKKKDPLKTRLQRLTLISQALRLRPNFPEALIELVGLGFSDSGKNADQWIYDAKADARPGDSTLYAADILLGLRALYKEDEATAAEYFESAKKLDANFPFVLAGMVQAVEGKSEVSSKIIETVKKDDSVRDVELRKGAKFSIQSMLANHAVRERDFKKAVKFYRVASEMNPQSAQAKNNLAFCLIYLPEAGKKEFEEALKLADQSIEKNPNINNFYETRGNVHMKLGNYKAALADFEKALDLGFARAAKIWPLLAKANRAIGREKQAQSFERKWNSLPKATRQALTDLYFTGDNENLLPGEKKQGSAGSDEKPGKAKEGDKAEEVDKSAAAAAATKK